jgi:hypothetical protein
MAINERLLYRNRSTPPCSSYPTCSGLTVRLNFLGSRDAITQMIQDAKSAVSDLEIVTASPSLLPFSRCYIESPTDVNVSLDLRDHVDWFLNKLPIEVYRSLAISKRGIIAELECQWVSANGIGGPTLWPEQMQELGERNWDLTFDFRFGGELWWKQLPLTEEFRKEVGEMETSDSAYNCERTYAELRIYPAIIDVSAVTHLLNANPTTSISRGDLRPNGKVFRLSVWSISSETFVKSLLLQDHLEWLLSKVKLSDSQQQALQQDVDLRLSVYCVWWSKNGIGGPRIASSHMLSLATSGLEFTIDAQYFEDQE